MSKIFESALARIVEVVMFENWLRFYFITEEGEVLVMRLPEKSLQKLQEECPQLVELAATLNNQEIDHKTSLNAICLFVAKEIDGSVVPEEMMQEVFNSSRFQLELGLFSTWVQNHEEQLDATFASFTQWLQMYGQWRATDEVQQYIQGAQETAVRFATNTTETTQ